MRNGQISKHQVNDAQQNSGIEEQLKRTNQEKRSLIPVPEWNNHHSWPPPGGLRHLIFQAAHNGFDKCIRRVGRRVLIDEAAFFAWVDEQNGVRA